jgi:indolepyruvate ferredoxin oxidoreductase alpha subunit
MLLGDEALAQGAMDAGISGAYAYPGTPSTEIMEYIQRSKHAIDNDLHRTWSSNEKTAVEAAIGMSYAGKRTIVCMKHVGLNVAADPFMNSAFTGANGGLLIVVADDPSMHSSQNEQDSRFYGKFAMLPILEPSNQQECYDMTFYGFELSERYHVPVLIRLTTRLSHSRAGVLRQDIKNQNILRLPEDPNQFVLLPAFARRKYKNLIKMQDDFVREAENSSFNKIDNTGKNNKLGIIACGLAYNYLKENFGNEEVPYPVLKICQYPISETQIKTLYNNCDEILVLEEGMPLVEELIKGLAWDGTKKNQRKIRRNNIKRW